MLHGYKEQGFMLGLGFHCYLCHCNDNDCNESKNLEAAARITVHKPFLRTWAKNNRSMFGWKWLGFCFLSAEVVFLFFCLVSGTWAYCFIVAL